MAAGLPAPPIRLSTGHVDDASSPVEKPPFSPNHPALDDSTAGDDRDIAAEAVVRTSVAAVSWRKRLQGTQATRHTAEQAPEPSLRWWRTPIPGLDAHVPAALPSRRHRVAALAADTTSPASTATPNKGRPCPLIRE
ncbi:hypothetical protein GCM10010121_098010 [Streptomyces brasiliensis]|uniref:Uncharacterized protein n=1 Tax=Streptomyces brasiliensis TaxID=1954 RepID=A0A917PDN6_9ACTN|nr:hypothetical protein GCM10010121_098010 [Streptomyces brasiliensis]